jgi:hypothetical protein
MLMLGSSISTATITTAKATTTTTTTTTSHTKNNKNYNKNNNNNQQQLTLRFLNVPVGIFSPSIRDADVGVNLLNASMKVDAARGVLQLVTSVI